MVLIDRVNEIGSSPNWDRKVNILLGVMIAGSGLLAGGMFAWVYWR